ncbi:MAG: hypothetical protein NTX23_06710 [Candidatus Bipolaricaulota bacterium]|nr:hypothetical protein [Candidatus Bipolaricaulota bacterium]
MKSRAVKLALVVVLVAAGVVVLSPVVRRDASTQSTGAGQGPLIVNLAPPAFAQSAGSKFPMNEAGISAYVNMGATIDLTKARALLSAPEDATDTYVIGTIPLGGNDESMWPHVYIGSDGWLLAYYPNTEPTSFLFQWYGYQGGTVKTTTLRDVLISLATNLHLDLSKTETGISYFHFKYPDATKLIIAVDTVSGGDEFRYTIPSGVALYDAAWTHHAEGVVLSYGNGGTASSVDGKSLYSGGGGTYTVCSEMAQQYESPNTAHSVAISQSGASGWMGFAIVFLYR